MTGRASTQCIYPDHYTGQTGTGPGGSGRVVPRPQSAAADLRPLSEPSGAYCARSGPPGAIRRETKTRGIYGARAPGKKRGGARIVCPEFSEPRDGRRQARGVKPCALPALKQAGRSQVAGPTRRAKILRIPHRTTYRPGLYVVHTGGVLAAPRPADLAGPMISVKHHQSQALPGRGGDGALHTGPARSG